MRIAIVLPSTATKSQRLDANHFLAAGVRARALLAEAQLRGTELRRLGGVGGIGRVWSPQRFRRIYAAPGEERVPYLRPYDVFNYLPLPADWLSKRKTWNLEALTLREGIILQTCSGRNLGPAVSVDPYLASFALSHDMIRLEIDDEELRYYVLAFLQTKTGQELIRRDKTGSVIDHIAEAHLEAQLIPMFGSEIERKASQAMAKAVRLRGEAREAIAAAVQAYESSLPLVKHRAPPKKGWTVRVTQLRGRLDVAPYNPTVLRIRKDLTRIGAMKLGAVAVVRKPAGRYKTNYVEKEHGVPVLSGGQVLQAMPVKLKFMQPSVFSKIERYRLKEGWVVFQADGRAEEGLGFPAVITADRKGWLASGHVGRLIPKDGVESGWLYLAGCTKHVLLQIKSMACGSVIDALYEEDVQDVLMPPPLNGDVHGVRTAWRKFAQAQYAENMAKDVVEQEFLRVAGIPLPPGAKGTAV